MAERFNYTNRAVIEHRDVHIHLVRQGDDVRFKAAIDFEHYQFPDEARVFIEVYRGNHLVRFDFGTVGAFALPKSTSIAEFGEEAGAVLYRVKVVGADERKSILGMPNRGIGKRADNAEGGASDCLLPVNLLPEGTEQVWALDFEGDYPRLLVNRNLDKSVLDKDAFVALVYPAALRDVLGYTFLMHHDGKGCIWAEDWKQFAAVNLDEPFPDIADLPELDDAYRQTVSEWIDNVVESFAAGGGLADKVNGGMA